MPLRKRDTARAISLLEDYCSKLKKPEEQQLKTAILRVMGIFKSSLFQALIDIQEFYEVTLLNSQKSCEQKLVEVNHMAEQWEYTATNSTSPTECPQPASTPPEATFGVSPIPWLRSIPTHRCFTFGMTQD
ncbi:disks large homolog 1-like isoform X1 [Puntigrus tetrazona]|uniref:disks large homolog 1-like isoform X1 n=1 Tax=Puntigrus tetrazona TaxID=1606681 RepID=UPI001C8ADF1C|nr:disks large homolog 1-like isoform X1 [Puntigrus tetrazona]